MEHLVTNFERWSRVEPVVRDVGLSTTQQFSFTCFFPTAATRVVGVVRVAALLESRPVALRAWSLGRGVSTSEN